MLSDIEYDVATVMPLNRDPSAVPHGTVLSVGMPRHVSSSFLEFVIILTRRTEKVPANSIIPYIISHQLSVSS